MPTEVNKALVRRYREAHTMKNLALLDGIVAADIMSHSCMQGLPIGFQGSTSTRHPTSPHFRNAPQSTCVNYLLSKSATSSYAYYRHPSTQKSPRLLSFRVNMCPKE